MKGKKMILPLLLAVVMLVGACGFSQIKTFSRGEPGWTDISVAAGLQRDVLLNKVVEIVVRESYEPELISKDTGYMRTKWKRQTNVVSSGFFGSQKTEVETYRTRIVAQVSANAQKVGLKCEAEQLEDGRWIRGYDTEKLKDISEAIRGTVGGY